MKVVQDLAVKVFADGADLKQIYNLATHPLIKGFTTNPSLMKNAYVEDYEAFAKDVISIVDGRPVSFEVFSDDFEEMERQARTIASWGTNVYVKIPVVNTLGEFAGPLIGTLTNSGVQVNVTAVMTVKQVDAISAQLSHLTPSIVSLFAGRVADTGIDPVPVMAESVEILSGNPLAELLWASPRELFNIYQAHEVGCQIITVTPDIISKLPLVGKNLDEYSLETSKAFFNDAVEAGFEINIKDAILGQGRG